jgi:hypothetical protein
MAMAFLCLVIEIQMNAEGGISFPLPSTSPQLTKLIVDVRFARAPAI